MNKKYFIEGIINLIVSLLVIFITNFLLALPFTAKGEVIISDVYKTSDISYQRHIEINNFTDKYIEDLLVKVPLTCSIDNEKYINTLEIENKKNMDELTLFSLNMIEPKSSTILLISQETQDEQIIFTNLHEKKLTLIKERKKYSPIIALAKSVLPNAIIYAIMFAIFTLISSYFTDKTTEELNRRINVNDGKIDILQNEINKNKEYYKKSINSIQKRIMLLKLTLRDYVKELDFWRNVVKNLLFIKDKSNTNAENLFSIVTNTLKTYTIKSKDNKDIDEIFFLADQLTKDDNKHTKLDGIDSK